MTDLAPAATTALPGATMPVAAGSPRLTRGARLLQSAGLWVAPLAILVLSLLLFFYYQSLQSSGSSAVVSALEWRNKLQPQTIRVVYIAFWSTLLVIVVAVPLGVLLTRPALRRVSPVVLAVANAGQAVPAYGLLVIFLGIMNNVTGTGQRPLTAILALALFALLPVLRNTMVGLDGVDRSVIEAGRGMGMTRVQTLTRIELPLAVPIILAGVRTAMILNIGMAALAFLIGGGGLGITIQTGLKLNQDPILIVGAWLVALVALTFSWLGALAERFLKPRGL